MNEKESLDVSGNSDTSEDAPVIVGLIGPDGCRLGRDVAYDSAITLWAVMSEDPHSWDEIAAYWPRYRTPATSEFLDALPIPPCERDALAAAIENSQDWLLLDLVDKRVFTGRNLQRLSHNATLAMVVDERGRQHCPLPIHLPPWWELHEQVDASRIDQPRRSEIEIPYTNRPLLFGTPMIDDLAARIWAVVGQHRIPIDHGNERELDNAWYALTVEVHRDWLMTPRADLEGRPPRDLLHGAHGWSDSIVWGQRQRFEDGAPMIAAPAEVVGYDDAPMGREEMIIYFDLCRELIDAGWQWCRQQDDVYELADKLGSEPPSQLRQWLTTARDHWLQAPFEGGSPPSFIIECSRRRVPRGAEVPIIGMDRCESEQHMPDCDCPICDMLQSGLFGVGFTSLDGHHLEMDDEFAFSTHQFHDDWAREQSEFREMNAAFERDIEAHQAKIAAGEIEEDEFASAWMAPISDDPLPGDPQGHMRLAFRLAEIVGDLQTASAPQELIRNLNEAFRQYRESEAAEHQAAAQTLGQQLTATAERYPQLVSKVVDFQSQLDEHARGPMASHMTDDDAPF